MAKLLGAHLKDSAVKPRTTTSPSNTRSSRAHLEEEAQAKQAKEMLVHVANQTDILSSVIIGLATGGRAQAALRVAKRCLQQGFQLQHKHLWLAMLNSANEATGEKIWATLQQAGCHIDNEAWSSLIRTKGDNSVAAMGVLRRMQQQRVVATAENCSAILESCVADRNQEGTSKMLKTMHTRSMQINPAAFCRMVQAAVRPGTKEALSQGIEVLQFMRSSGARPDLKTCKAILTATATLGDAATAILLMIQIQNSNELNKKKKEKTLIMDEELCLLYVRSLTRGQGGQELTTAYQFVCQHMCAVGSGVVAGTAVWSMLLEGCAKSE